MVRESRPSYEEKKERGWRPGRASPGQQGPQLTSCPLPASARAGDGARAPRPCRRRGPPGSDPLFLPRHVLAHSLSGGPGRLGVTTFSTVQDRGHRHVCGLRAGRGGRGGCEEARAEGGRRGPPFPYTRGSQQRESLCRSSRKLGFRVWFGGVVSQGDVHTGPPAASPSPWGLAWWRRSPGCLRLCICHRGGRVCVCSFLRAVSLEMDTGQPSGSGPSCWFFSLDPTDVPGPLRHPGAWPPASRPPAECRASLPVSSGRGRVHRGSRRAGPRTPSVSVTCRGHGDPHDGIRLSPREGPWVACGRGRV